MIKTLHRYRLLLAPIALTIIISGCGTTPDDRTAQQDIFELIKFAEKAEQDGDYEAAGNAYKQLALITPQEQRADYQIKAINSLLTGNYIEQAKRLQQLLPSETLTPTQQLELNLASARLALAENDPALALKQLKSPLPIEATNKQRAHYHLLRAQAYQRAGNLIEAVREHVLREPYLAAPLDAPSSELSEIDNNQLQIWQSLMALSDDMLLQLRVDPAPDPFSGWLELAYLTKQAQGSETTVDLTQSLTTWQQRYPEQRVSDKILTAITAMQSGIVFEPKQIALLLPMSGNFSRAATVIRDGFLAAHFDNRDAEESPVVRIYDTTAQGSTIPELYQQAVDEGAEFVVGPLKKSSVDQLIESDLISVPTMTLNYSNDPEHSGLNLFQFGLSPENEAHQVAERAWLDGHNQALAIVPEGKWGARILNAFTESWESLGGSVVEHQSYTSKNNDFSEPIRNMLNIDESEKRKKQLQQIVGSPLKFEPRRRQDADFVFMVGLPRQARLIKPQLKFHYASDLPVYATSHIYSGVPDKEANRDLDEITFCDIPWVLSGSRGEESLDQRIKQLWPDDNSQYTRFFALGIDAYNLIPHIKHMATFRYERLNGETGTLSLDETNRVFRQLPWARFRRGTVRPL